MASDPSFGKPPLVEVSFSIQFEPIEGFHIGLIGSTWELYRDRYPIAENATELAHQIEKFGVIDRKSQQLNLKLVEGTPEPRVIFYTADKQYLIQVQKDRFILNWRKCPSPGFEYPRYESLKARFFSEYQIFENSITRNSLAKPTFNQVEFTYVNHIDATTYTVNDVFNNVIEDSSLSQSMKLESFSINLKHLITKDEQNIGRLYTSIEKGNLVSDGSDIYILKFLSRAHPLSSAHESIDEVMDLMREKINSSFTAITTPKMHEEWQRKEV